MPNYNIPFYHLILPKLKLLIADTLRLVGSQQVLRSKELERRLSQYTQTSMLAQLCDRRS